VTVLVPVGVQIVMVGLGPGAPVGVETGFNPGEGEGVCVLPDAAG
jgi:hypothetical protein